MDVRAFVHPPRSRFAKRPVHVAILVLFLSLMLLAPAAAQEAPSETHRRTVSVSGEGIVRVEPDMATVHFGVVTVADDPESARAENAEASSRAMNAVRALGIEERFLRLESVQLQPHREWAEDRGRYVERGYEATRQVVVEVHDLDLLPLLVAEVVEQGANRLNRVGYDLKDREAARNDALREAVLNARAKAVLIAETLGEAIARVRSVSEQSFDFPRPTYRVEAMEMSARGAPEPDAYAAGELEVRVSVQVVFELE